MQDPARPGVPGAPPSGPLSVRPHGAGPPSGTYGPPGAYGGPPAAQTGGYAVPATTSGPVAIPQHFEAVARAPAAPPKKPGFFGKLVRDYGPSVLVLAIAVALYGGFKVREMRQPYEWSGSVECKTVALGSRIGGRVASVRVAEGDAVAEGDVLVVLEPGELKSQLVLAEAELEAAQASLDKLRNGARDEEVVAARARVWEARAAHSQASEKAAQELREKMRAQTLHASGAISAADRDSRISSARTASDAALQASASSRAAEAALMLLTKGTRMEDLRAGQAQVAMAKAKVTAIKDQIEELTIRAPRAGRVESVAIRPGDILRPNATAATLLEKGQLYVTIFVPETLVSKVHVGQEVPVTVDGYPNRTFRGRIDHINEVGEFTPRRMATTEERTDEVFGSHVTLLEGESELRAGMAAFIHVKK